MFAWRYWSATSVKFCCAARSRVNDWSTRMPAMSSARVAVTAPSVSRTARYARLVDRLDVVREPADDHTGAIPLVETEREALQMTEELVPEVGEHALTRPAGEVRLPVRECNRETARDDEQRDEPAEIARCAVPDVVDRSSDEVRRSERHHRRAEE